MLTIFSYLTAFLIFMLVNKVILVLVLIPFKPLIGINKKLQYFASFIYALLASFIGVYLYIIISDNSSLSLSWFMLLIPAIILSIVDHQRIEKAKKGISGIRFILEANNEPESYDQKIDVRNEQVGSYSRIFGFLLALYLFMAGEPFF